LHCGVQEEEEETSNLAVQLHYGINENEESKGAIVHSIEDDALCYDSDKELSQ
jgi:hypothetical protein